MEISGEATTNFMSDSWDQGGQRSVQAMKKEIPIKKLLLIQHSQSLGEDTGRPMEIMGEAKSGMFKQRAGMVKILKGRYINPGVKQEQSATLSSSRDIPNSKFAAKIIVNHIVAHFDQFLTHFYTFYCLDPPTLGSYLNSYQFLTIMYC